LIQSKPLIQTVKTSLIPNRTLFAAAIACQIQLSLASRPRDMNFDADWRFHRGDATGAEQAAFDDSGWRVLDMPHDWSIEDLPPVENKEPSVAVEPEGWKFAIGDDMGRAAADFDDSAWKLVRIPAGLGGMGFEKVRSMGWFRRGIDVPKELHGRDFLLKIGVVDDADETFFNGVKIGGHGGMPPDYDSSTAPWGKPRIYRVPARLVKGSGNVLAVRMYNHEGEGGILRTLPDFAVVGPFSPESEGGPATGHTVGGTGWYRKHFALDAAEAGRLVSILFDGVYMDSDVWINGHHLGNRPYGYSAFAYDLTPHLKPAGGENLLSVRVRNEGKNSRWYSGSGIYRHVTLTTTDPLRIARWGVVVTTPQVSKSSATVRVVTAVANSRKAGSDVRLRVKLSGPDGREVSSAEASSRVAADGRVEIPLNLQVQAPALWSPESPQLCRAEVQVLEGDKIVDKSTTTFGIREIRFSVDKGFTLNGEPVELRGACLHHDNGPLGAVAIDRAEERRVELMKAQGYNAIRTSHNPPSAVFLDACDRLGMLVMNEAFDCWEKGKNPEDYGRYFNDWWQRDLAAMILRDRNHPSVILWSIGNEIPQRADEAGYVIAKNLADEVRRLDPTRPVTEGVCNFWDQPGRPWSDTDKAFTFLDVGGYNYEPMMYEGDHKKFPDRIMVGTESYPGELVDYWRLVEKHPYVIGDFVWTGMDYIGEAGCGHMRFDNEPSDFGRGWPWFNAFCGDLDICGFRKPQSFFRDVVWGRSPLEMMVHRPLPPGRTEQMSRWGWPDELPSWTWPGEEGMTLEVTVYSACDTVRLELNGKEIATRKLGEDDEFRAKFGVPYQPGELRAVGLKQGTIVAARTLRSAGPAARIRLVADRQTIRADRNDLSYVAVEITDAEGNLLPDAALPVRFSVNGEGDLAAAGSGCPNKPEGFQGPLRTTWHGRALAILRPKGGAGSIRLRAESPGLSAGKIEVKTVGPASP
jgi:beta-galactosidase